MNNDCFEFDNVPHWISPDPPNIVQMGKEIKNEFGDSVFEEYTKIVLNPHCKNCAKKNIRKLKMVAPGKSFVIGEPIRWIRTSGKCSTCGCKLNEPENNYQAEF